MEKGVYLRFTVERPLSHDVFEGNKQGHDWNNCHGYLKFTCILQIFYSQTNRHKFCSDLLSGLNKINWKSSVTVCPWYFQPRPMFFLSDSELSYVYKGPKSKKVHGTFGLGWKYESNFQNSTRFQFSELWLWHRLKNWNWILQ